MATTIFGVGIIGYGMSAKVFHIPLILVTASLKLAAVVQRTVRPDDNPSVDHPGVRTYRSTGEMLNDPEIDVVVVTTTPETHFELTALALHAGKHVIVEKPFTPTYQEANELTALAKKQRRLLSVYQNRRWDADFLTLRALLKEGRLGRVTDFETHFDRHRPIVPASRTWKMKPAPGVGAIYDLGSHLIDQVLVCFGMPKQVTGFMETKRAGDEEGLEDSCTILLWYNNGLCATVRATVVSPEVEQLRFWVRGTEGSFKKFHLDVQEDQLRKGMKPGDTGYGMDQEQNFGILSTVKGERIESSRAPTIEPETYAKFYQLFAQALDGKGEVPVSPEDAANVIRIVELARQSSNEGRTITVDS